MTEVERLKLTQLRYFQAACRLGSITAAAEYLHISQPSVSAAIRELETEFGITLLNRRYRGFSLTQAGQVLLEQADSLLAHAARVETVMTDLATQKRQIRLGIPPMIGSLLLPRLYQDFFSQMPGLDVTITEGGRRELLQLLAENQLDIMFLPHGKTMDPGYTSVVVTQLETVCCVSPKHPLSGMKQLRIRDLAQESLVLFKNSFFQTEAILQRFADNHMEPKVLLNTNQLSTIHKLISSGVAAGFLFRDLVSPLDNIVPIPLEPPMYSLISLVWKSSNPNLQAMEPLIRFVKDLYK